MHDMQSGQFRPSSSYPLTARDSGSSAQGCLLKPMPLFSYPRITSKGANLGNRLQAMARGGVSQGPIVCCHTGNGQECETSTREERDDIEGKGYG